MRPLLALLASLILASPAEAIVGGRAATPAEAPFVVALVAHRDSAFDGLSCGGSLIARDVVLTAAHCVRGERAARIDVVAGRTRLDTTAGERVGVAEIAISPRYDRRTDEHDVALLRLAQPVAAGGLIGLPVAGARPVAGAAATVYGWGLISRRGDAISRRLRAADLVIRSDRACRALYAGDFSSRQAVCANSPEAEPSANACEGDSGGPLVTTGAAGPMLVGVVSYGLAACSSRRHPDVFAEVGANRGWLVEQRERWNARRDAP